MKICIVGTGHVGLVTGACLAHIGHRVICVDSNVKKIKILNKDQIPFYEPGLEKIVKECRKNKRLTFTSSLSEGTKKSGVIFISVNTPPRNRMEAPTCIMLKKFRARSQNLSNLTS